MTFPPSQAEISQAEISEGTSLPLPSQAPEPKASPTRAPQPAPAASLPTSLGDIPERFVRTHLDPFAPIHKRPSHTESSHLTGYGIEIADPKDESGFSLAGTVSPDYLLVPNTRVREIAHEITSRSAFDFRPQRLFFDGKRFLYTLRAHAPAARRRVGGEDEIALSILFSNSYDGSQAFRARLFSGRIICSNGMISGEYFARYRFRHVGGNGTWEEETKKALSVIEAGPEQLERFVGGLEALKDKALTSRGLHEMTTDLSGLPDTRFGQIMRRYLDEEEHTAYGLLNACTNVFWHRDKQTISDYRHNQNCVDHLLGYAFENLN